MSCNYAEGLSYYENKGKLGLPERFENKDSIEAKVNSLVKWIKESKHTVFHTGAGISTASGIPDFRGPKGVWTLEEKGIKPDINVAWEEAIPTFTHMAIVALEKAGYLKFVVTQNIDGLHLRSGLSRRIIAELHGNIFLDRCSYCHKLFVRGKASETVGQRSSGIPCPASRSNGRVCRGKLQDNVLDWEDHLPEPDLELSELHSCAADLSICLGSTLQIVPSGNLPLYTKRRGGKLVICNLQPTKQDRHADLIINTYVDDVMRLLLRNLDIKIVPYMEESDPVWLTRENHLNMDFKPFEWTCEYVWAQDKSLVLSAKRPVIRARKLYGIDKSKPQIYKTSKRHSRWKKRVSPLPKCKFEEGTTQGGIKDNSLHYLNVVSVNITSPKPEVTESSDVESYVASENLEKLENPQIECCEVKSEQLFALSFIDVDEYLSGEIS